MVQRLALVLIVAILAQQALAGEPADDPFRLQIPKGVKAEKDVYIPRDLDDCFAEMGKMFSKGEIEKMKTGHEEQMDSYPYSFLTEKVKFVGQIDQGLRARWQGGLKTQMQSGLKK